MTHTTLRSRFRTQSRVYAARHPRASPPAHRKGLRRSSRVLLRCRRLLYAENHYRIDKGAANGGEKDRVRFGPTAASLTPRPSKFSSTSPPLSRSPFNIHRRSPRLAPDAFLSHSASHFATENLSMAHLTSASLSAHWCTRNVALAPRRSPRQGCGDPNECARHTKVCAHVSLTRSGAGELVPRPGYQRGQQNYQYQRKNGR